MVGLAGLRSGRPGGVPVPVGTRVRVRVPATSANLGPGFDALGLALDWVDELEFEVIEDGVRVEVTGEGADSLPRDESHLIVSTLRNGLAALHAEAPGLVLRAHNTIPHSRGLGSSAAAIVAGLAGAWALARRDESAAGRVGDRRGLDRQWLLEQATAIEGHADNVAAAVLGGFVISWTVPGVRAVTARVDPGVRAMAYVPARPVSTRSARGALPKLVPHAEAALNSGRAALLVHALAAAPELLLPATQEWLHQGYRADLMPESTELIGRLRAAGHAAVVSGAGPTVLVLGTEAEIAALEPEPGFREYRLRPGAGVSLVRD
ncbi:homoserine kinase [Granulicoccus phenolivorans]|uniref:homoserine kinase n=1 Tax=Granulicoccus phenolivorans TaxID=266854 RepID=UPI0004181386|nr:homoserine kinase [Granulicoccus phenolivorans]